MATCWYLNVMPSKFCVRMINLKNSAYSCKLSPVNSQEKFHIRVTCVDCMKVSWAEFFLYKHMLESCSVMNVLVELC